MSVRELKYYNSNTVGLCLFISLLLLSSCIGNEECMDQPVSPPVLFNAMKGTVTVEERQTTRAGIDESNPAMDSMDDLVASNKEMLIYGARYTDGGSPDWTAGNLLFMNGLTGPVEKNGTDYRINYSPQKYYDPEDDERYDFKLFFPAPQAPASGLQDPSGVTILTPTNERPLGFRVNLYRRPDLLKATLTGKSKSNQPLGLDFEHMLTSVVLKIVKDDYTEPTNPDSPEQNIYINRLTISGVIRGTYDIIKEEFEPPVKVNTNPELVDAASGASILVPGYTTDEKFLVPMVGEEPKRIREIFLFPVAPEASTAREDLERYFFDIWLNERRYSFMIPNRNDAGWEGWRPGERYTYTIKVSKADIYIELDKDHISREPWKPEDKEDITIGVGAD